MKTQIENSFSDIYEIKQDVLNIQLSLFVLEFDRILHKCLLAEDETELRSLICKKTNYKFFKYHFGSNHFALIEIQSGKRILFIDFTAQK